MPCPYFAPDQPLGPGQWAIPPRLPLGEAYSGSCHAHPGEFHVAPEAQVRDVCNYGYARGRCDRFPCSGNNPDAVRFSIVSKKGHRVRIVYLFETEHAPAGHGELAFSTADNAFMDAESVDALLLRQARAFVESYLRMKG